MAMPPGLRLRGGTYWYRKRVPLDLRAELGGELKRSLHTADPAEARRKRNAIAHEFDLLFERTRAERTGHPAPVATMSRDQLLAIARKYVSDEERAEISRFSQGEQLSPVQREGVLQDIGYAVREYRDPNSYHTEFNISRLCDDLAPNLSPQNSPEFYELVRRGALEVNRRMLMWLQGDHRQEGFDHLFARNESEGTSGPTPAPRTIGQYCEEFLQEYRANKTVSRDEKVTSILELVSGYFGREQPLAALNVNACRAFRNFLAEVPANRNKRLPGIADPRKQVAEAQRRGFGTLSRNTQIAYLSVFKQLVRDAHQREYIARDYAAGLAPVGPRSDPSEDRRSFTTEQLRRIFGSDQFAPEHHPLHSETDSGSVFWAPLISLFMGLRANEICQLDISDGLVNADKLLCVSIRPSDDKRVKNVQSTRTLPIHPELIRIGFPQYVEHRRRRAQFGEKLFPDVRLSKKGYYSDRLSRHYQHFLVQIEAKTTKTSFHSFRHTFRDALREFNPPREIARALGGWKQRRETMDDYGDGVKPKHMEQYLNQVQYPELDFSSLYRT